MIYQLLPSKKSDILLSIEDYFKEKGWNVVGQNISGFPRSIIVDTNLKTIWIFGYGATVSAQRTHKIVNAEEWAKKRNLVPHLSIPKFTINSELAVKYMKDGYFITFDKASKEEIKLFTKLLRGKAKINENGAYVKFNSEKEINLSRFVVR